MGTKPKTRFYAIVDGKKIEVFSVRERTDGSIVLMPRHGKYHNDRDVLDAIKEQHYSVHIGTNESKDTTITQKTLLESGRHISNVAFVHDTAEHILWPVYACRLFMLGDERPAFSSRAKDRAISLGCHESLYASLMYTAFVTRASFGTEPGPHRGVKFISAKFGELQIIVAVSYLNLPTLQTGDVCGLASSPTVENGIFLEDHSHTEFRSFKETDLKLAHWGMVETLRNKYLQRLYKLGYANDNWPGILEISAFVTAEPMVQRKQVLSQLMRQPI